MLFFRINLWIILIEEALIFAARSERQMGASNDGMLIIAPGHQSNQERKSNGNINVNLLGSKNGDKLEEKMRGSDILGMVASLSGANDINLETPTRVSPSNVESREKGDYEGKLSNFDWHLKLDEAKRYWLEWRVEYKANRILFALGINKTANFRLGSDIFALGFSNYGLLNSSDFCFIWYDLSHTIHLQDVRTNADYKLELIDTSESVCKLLGASKNQLAKKSEHNLRGRSLRDFDDIGEDYGKELSILEREVGILNRDDESQFKVVFERPLDVCSSNNYYTIDNGTTHLVWFTMRGPLLTMDELNLSDFISSSSSNAKSDAFEFGMKRVQLIATQPSLNPRKSKSVSNNNHQAEFRMDNYRIPAKETTYWCKLFKLDSHFKSRKYHITKYEAIIDDGNEHVVHHMELFNCAALNSKQELDLKDLYENRGGWSGDCNDLKRPKETEVCRRVILAWAMGAHPLEYPEEVGQSIGGYEYSPYVVLEIHYNNVKFIPNLVDNSGLKFEYTSKLRPFDAGILEVGLEYTEKNSIPPNMITPIAGYCVSECTRAAMTYPSISLKHKLGQRQETRKQLLEKHNHHYYQISETLAKNAQAEQQQQHIQMMNDYDNLEDGIYIFAAQMHTHLAGIASWTEHIRGGKLLNELQRDNHYSPHFQEIRLLPKPVHVAPGDALIHYCLYDTTKRNNITLGGYSTSDEMCVTYLHYYPKIDLEVCKSSVDTEAIEAYFAYLAREEKQRTSLRLKELSKENEFNENGSSSSNSNKNANNNGYRDSLTSDNPIEVKSISENYNSIEWSARRSRELVQFYSQAPLSIQCNSSNGDRFPGYWNGIPASQLWTAEQSLVQSRLFDFPSAGTTNPEKLVGYRGSARFNRRHARCQEKRFRLVQ